MKTRYITCSDLREDVPINDAINLLSVSDKVELGIQAHPSAMSNGMPRNIWFNELLKISKYSKKAFNIAVHVNYQWCSEFCQGKIAPEIRQWMNMKNKNTGELLIKRWQLNIGDNTAGFDAYRLAQIIADNQQSEFIFPYNNIKSVQKSVAVLDETGAKFSLLYDASYGYGITPDSWDGPAFENHPQGYAGGLGGDNVQENLDKISCVVPKNYEIWIDAEGMLMKPGTRQFCLNRAHNYVGNALVWFGERTR